MLLPKLYALTQALLIRKTIVKKRIGGKNILKHYALFILFKSNKELLRTSCQPCRDYQYLQPKLSHKCVSICWPYRSRFNRIKVCFGQHGWSRFVEAEIQSWQLLDNPNMFKNWIRLPSLTTASMLDNFVTVSYSRKLLNAKMFIHFKFGRSTDKTFVTKNKSFHDANTSPLSFF
jgi:hypothetical protein